MRTLDVYNFLRFTPSGQKLIDIMPSSDTAYVLNYIELKLQRVQNTEEMEHRYRRLYNHWQALIIALAMGYYFRLPLAGNGPYNRTGFVNNMNRYGSDYRSNI